MAAGEGARSTFGFPWHPIQRCWNTAKPDSVPADCGAGRTGAWACAKPDKLKQMLTQSERTGILMRTPCDCPAYRAEAAFGKKPAPEGKHRGLARRKAYLRMKRSGRTSEASRETGNRGFTGRSLSGPASSIPRPLAARLQTAQSLGVPLLRSTVPRHVSGRFRAST